MEIHKVPDELSYYRYFRSRKENLTLKLVLFSDMDDTSTLAKDDIVMFACNNNAGSVSLYCYKFFMGDEFHESGFRALGMKPTCSKWKQVNEIFNFECIYNFEPFKNEMSLVAIRDGTDIDVYTLDTCDKKPICKLVGNDSLGFPMAWSTLEPGLFLSGNLNGQICIWNIHTTGDEWLVNSKISPMQSFETHNSQSINDVAWSPHNRNVYVTVGDDGRVKIFDKRHSSNASSVTQTNKVDAEIRKLLISPYCEDLLITGQSDATTSLWDQRKLKKATFTLKLHEGAVNELCWNPFKSTIIASGSEDGTVIIFDISKFNSTPLNKSKVTSSIISVHKLYDSQECTGLSWSANNPLVLASIAGSKVIEVFQLDPSKLPEAVMVNI